MQVRIMLEELRATLFRGDFNALRSETATGPFGNFEHCLLLTRCFFEQGDVRSARRATEHLPALAETAWDRARLSMHRILFDALAGQDLVTGELASRITVDQFAEQHEEPAQIAELEGMACRIKLMAVAVHQSTLDDCLDRLALATAGMLEVDIERAARMMVWHTSNQPDFGTRWSVAETWAECLASTPAAYRRTDLWLTVAEKSLETSSVSRSAERAIDLAAAAHDPAKSPVSTVDIDFAQARLGRRGSPEFFDSLEDCVVAYRRLAHYQRLIVAHAKLSTVYGERGLAAATEWHRDENTRIIEETGFGLKLGADVLDSIARERETGDPVKALQMCDRELVKDRPRISHVGLLHARGLCRSTLGLLGDAVSDIDAAATLARSHGAQAFASEIDLDRATLRFQLGGAAAFQEADNILASTAPADFAADRTVLGVRKLFERASLRYSRAVRIDSRHPPAYLLTEANALLDDLTAQIETLPETVRDRLKLAELQLRGHVRLALGEARAAEQTTEQALKLAQSSGFRIFEAGCWLMLGLRRQNDLKAAIRVRDVDAVARLGSEADEMLSRAQNLYEGAGALDMAGRAALYRAELFADALLVPELSSHQGLAEGFFSLHDAAIDVQNRRRREALLQDPRGRLSIMRQTVGDFARLDATMGRFLHLQLGQANTFWDWMRRTKARGYVEWLAAVARKGSDADNPVHTAQLEVDGALRDLEGVRPDRREALMQERYRARRAELSHVAEVPDVDFPDTTVERATAWLSALDRPVALVDWAVVAGRLVLAVLDVRHGLRIRDLSVLESDVMPRVANVMNPRSVCSALLGDEGLLDDFQDLVSPLKDMTEPGDLLVLAPTGGLWSLPLHAIRCDDEPLIARNPIVYAPNMALLVGREPRPLRRSTGPAVFAGRSEIPPAANTIEDQIAALIGAEARFGSAATRAAFLGALETQPIVHFQGHAVHEPDDPLKSRLHLFDGALHAVDILETSLDTVDFVVLAACESGVSRIGAGDEQEGLAAMFVLNGVRRVMSTLWPVHHIPCSEIMETFYAAMFRQGMAPADALRKSCVELMRNPEYSSPYYWAPYFLAGDWRS